MKSDNISSIKEDQIKRNVARDLHYLNRLLVGLKHEDVSFKELSNKINHHNFNGSILITSSKCIFRHVSILALSKYFNRKTTYTITPLDTLVDIWFSNFDSNNFKKDIYDSDVLILQGKGALDRTVGPLRRVIIEVIETRKGMNKHTWLFLEGTTQEALNNTNSKLSLSDYIDRGYNY